MGHRRKVLVAQTSARLPDGQVCVLLGLARCKEHRLMVRNAHHKSLCYEFLQEMNAQEPDET